VASLRLVSPGAVTDGVVSFFFTSKKVIDFFSRRHHSHPLRPSIWSFVECSCKFSRKENYIFIRVPEWCHRGGPPLAGGPLCPPPLVTPLIFAVGCRQGVPVVMVSTDIVFLLLFKRASHRPVHSIYCVFCRVL